MSTPQSDSSGRQGRRRRSPEETRLEILDAARALLWELPFREMTVGQLMQGTSVGRSSFYLHFDDLYELAAALLELLDDELAQATREGRTTRTIEGAVEDALLGVVGVWQRHGPVIRAISDASTQDGRLEDLYREGYVQRSIDRICHAIQAGQAAGSVDRSLDPVEAATLLAFMTDAYLSDRIGRNPDVDPAASYRTLVLAWKRTLRIAGGD